MMICVFCLACIIYNALYIAHCLKQRRIMPAFGSAAVMALVAFGVMLLGFDTAW